MNPPLHGTLPRSAASSETDQHTGSGQKGLLAAGGVMGAMLASSCCILPLAFVSLGVSGAWIGNLTALAPYQPFFLAGALAFIGAGFWKVYAAPTTACRTGSSCPRPGTTRATKAALWTATMLVVVSVAIDLILPIVLSETPR